MSEGDLDARGGRSIWVWILGVGVVLVLAFLLFGSGGDDRDLADNVGSTEPIAGRTEDPDRGVQAGGRAPIAPEIEEYVSSCVGADTAAQPISVARAARCVNQFVAAVRAAGRAGIGDLSQSERALESARESAESLADKPDITRLDAGLIGALEAATDALDQVALTDVPSLDTAPIRRAVQGLRAGEPMSGQRAQMRQVLDLLGEALSTLSAGSAAAGV